MLCVSYSFIYHTLWRKNILWEGCLTESDRKLFLADRIGYKEPPTNAKKKSWVKRIAYI